MPVHLLSGMKGKFEVTEANAASISSIPGPSPIMQQTITNNTNGEIGLQLGG